MTVTCEDEDGTECNAVEIPDGEDCSKEVTYSYTLENIGEECMTITVVDRTRDGETENLIGLVENTELCPGETTVVKETETVDFCVAQETCTTVMAEADPPAGAPCFDSDEYCLETEAPPGECLVNVSFFSIDTPCRSIHP